MIMIIQHVGVFEFCLYGTFLIPLRSVQMPIFFILSKYSAFSRISCDGDDNGNWKRRRSGLRDEEDPSDDQD